MKALVFHKPGSVTVDNVPDPTIEQPDDVILRVTSTAICGSDLHIYNGFFPQKRDMVLGHEFKGVVEEAGSAVTALKKGDRVIVPFPIACGARFFCQHDLRGTASTRTRQPLRINGAHHGCLQRHQPSARARGIAW